MTKTLFARPRRRGPAALVLALVACGALAAAQQTTIMKPPPMPPGQGTVTRDLTQPPPTGTGVISGTVVGLTGGRPVRRATVRLSGTAPVMSVSATTDDQGSFTFKDLPAGQFNLTATKPGYLDAVYGQKRSGSGRPGTPIVLADAQQLTKLALPIARGGVITGTIVDDAGEPAFGTQVRALRYIMKSGERTLTTQVSAVADDRGIYRMPALPPGDYIVTATPPDNSAGDAMRAVEDQLATMAAARAGGGGAGGNASFVLNGALGGNMARALAPGDDNAPSSGYAPVYYPGTTAASGAQTLTLEVGEERSSVDLQLQLVPMGKITGLVVGDPKVLPTVSLQLFDNSQALPGMGVKSARVGPDGKFSFTSVPPGQYTVSARSGGTTFVSMDSSGGQMRMTIMATSARAAGPGPDANGPGGPPLPPMWASSDVSVDGRTPANVTLALQPGMTVSGKVAFDGAAQVPSDLTQIRLILSPASQVDSKGSSAMANVDADGRFKISDVSPGTYRLTATPPRGWRAASVEVATRDVLDFPLEVKANEDVSGAVVTFTDRSTELSGTLQDSNSQPTSDYTVVIFPQDQRYWMPQSRRIMATRPATDGKYAFTNLPPGDYRIIALNDVEPGQWYDPALLRQLMGAGPIAVTLNDGDKKVQDIRVAK
jgi:hypothetical protein